MLGFAVVEVVASLLTVGLTILNGFAVFALEHSLALAHARRSGKGKLFHQRARARDGVRQ